MSMGDSWSFPWEILVHTKLSFRKVQSFWIPNSGFLSHTRAMIAQVSRRFRSQFKYSRHDCTRPQNNRAGIGASPLGATQYHTSILLALDILAFDFQNIFGSCSDLLIRSTRDVVKIERRKALPESEITV